MIFDLCFLTVDLRTLYWPWYFQQPGPLLASAAHPAEMRKSIIDARKGFAQVYGISRFVRNDVIRFHRFSTVSLIDSDDVIMSKTLPSDDAIAISPVSVEISFSFMPAYCTTSSHSSDVHVASLMSVREEIRDERSKIKGQDQRSEVKDQTSHIKDHPGLDLLLRAAVEGCLQNGARDQISHREARNWCQRGSEFER